MNHYWLVVNPSLSGNPENQKPILFVRYAGNPERIAVWTRLLRTGEMEDLNSVMGGGFVSYLQDKGSFTVPLVNILAHQCPLSERAKPSHVTTVVCEV